MARARQTFFRGLPLTGRRRGIWLALVGLVSLLAGISAPDAVRAEPVVNDLRITVNNEPRSTTGAFFVDIDSKYTVHIFWPVNKPRADGHLIVTLRPADGGSALTLWDKPLDLTRPPADGAWTGFRIPMNPASPEAASVLGSGRDWIYRAKVSAAGVEAMSAETTVRLVQGPADAGFAQVRTYDDTRDHPGHPADGHPLPPDGAVAATARSLGYAWTANTERLPPGSMLRYRVTDEAGHVIEESTTGLPTRLQPGRPLILSERPIRNHPSGNGQMPAGWLTLTVRVETREGIVIDADAVRFRLPSTDARDPWGNALEVAACEGDAARVRSCLSAGCSLGPDNGAAAVMCAAEQGHADIMAMVLKQGASPHARSKDGRYSALFAAAQQGHGTTAQTLIRHGADPNRRDYRGGTALHAAVWGGHLSLVPSLLSNGGTPSIRDDKGRTAGYYAYWLHNDAALAARLGYHRPHDQETARPPADRPAMVSTQSENESEASANEIDLDDRGASSAWDGGPSDDPRTWVRLHLDTDLTVLSCDVSRHMPADTGPRYLSERFDKGEFTNETYDHAVIALRYDTLAQARAKCRATADDLEMDMPPGVDYRGESQGWILAFPSRGARPADLARQFRADHSTPR